MELTDRVERLDGLPVDIADLDVVLRDEHDAALMSVRVSDGMARVARVESSPSAAGDGRRLELKPTPGHLLSDVLFGAAPPIDRARMLMVRSETDAWAQHPPFDVELARQPQKVVPNVDVTIRHVCRDSLVGDLDFVERFRDGWLVDRVDPTDAPQVTVFSTFAKLTAAYDPTLDSLTAVTGMRIECVSPVMVLVAAGIYEDRVFRGFLDQRSHANRALSDFARMCRAVETR
ncbi:MAG: hypothetical protein ACE37B_19580 [Ilumatobacter sp.]|uniref:hypothetical protein n=1 Tax=Ilumatobacter sp. TaxID=1967498 RepID=UPI00391CD2D8